MAGGTFALVERSLRVESRSVKTHIIRLFFAGGLLTVLIFIEMENRSMSNPGGFFFAGICWVNMVLLNLAGMSFFSTIITEEKEEMTLGLLKMAGISGLGILAGKLAPRLISVLVLLSIQLPFTFLSITLGGISTEQVLAAYALLISFSILLSGVGMLLSTVCSRSSLSTALMTSFLVASYLVPWIGFSIAQAASFGRTPGLFTQTCIDVFGWLVNVSPLVSIDRILNTGYSAGILTIQVWTYLATGALTIGLSWLLFESFTRNEKPIAPSRGLGGIVLAFRGKSRTQNRQVWNNALAWKDFNFTTGGTTALIIKFGCYASLMFLISLTLGGSLSSQNDEAIGGLCWGSMLLALAIEIPVYFSRVFREEIRWQTWSGLVLLPESISTIAFNKLKGLLPTFLPALAIMAFGVMLNPRDFLQMIDEVFGDPGGYYALSQYALLVHLSVLMSVTVKWGALPLSIAIVVMLNMLFGFCMATSRSGSDAMFIVPTFMAFVACCVMIGLILDRLSRAGSK